MQHTHYLSSFHAVKISEDGRETVQEADEHGNVAANAGDVLIFKNPAGKKNVSVTEIVFRTGAQPLRVILNDNGLYPYVVPANSVQGVSGLLVYKLTVLGTCAFAYDALA